MSGTQLAAGPWSATATQSSLSLIKDGSLTNHPAVDGPRGDDAQLSHLFDISPDLLALASFKPHSWLRVNPAFCSVLGWASHELIGRPMLDIVHAADHDRVRAIETNTERLGAVNLEIRLLCKNGRSRWIAWHIAPDGEANSFLCIGRDVTQRRRTLRHFRTARVRMLRENQNLEQFVRTAGHDLQEPLRTLSMYSELLMRSSRSDLPASSIELLRHIFGAATRMQTLVRDLLVYAQVSQERSVSTRAPKPVSLETVFSDVLETLKSSIAEASALITHDSLPEVDGDETQLAQLLQNLLSNSLKYHRDDVPLKIHVGVTSEGDHWQFSVADNGCGFDPKYAEDIFLDFKRLHGREIPGTGLGLSICRRVVQHHAGRIWAEGRPGRGATFYFTLPIRPSMLG